MLSWLDRCITRIRVCLAKRPVIYLLGLGGINGLLIAGFSKWGPALTPAEPNGVDLQLSLSSGVFRQIIAIWTDAQEAAFIWTTWSLDSLFPIAYAAGVTAVYVWSCGQFGLRVRKLVFVSPWLAAIADYAENGLLLWILTGPRAAAQPFDPLRATDRAVGLMSGFAIAKFTFLTVAIAFALAAFFRGDIRRVVKVARYSVLSLVVGTLPMIALPQGRDLLLGLGNPDAFWHQFWFIFWVVIWALSVWYWSRVLLDADRANETPTPLYEKWSDWLPRVAGVMTLLLPGIAFLSVPQPRVAGSLTTRLGWICIVLSGVFLAFVYGRRKLTPGRATTSFKPSDLSTPSLVVLALSALSTVAMFRWLAFYPLTSGEQFGAVALLAIVGANTVFFGAVAVFFTRSRRIPLEFIALACAAAFSYWNDNHYVELKTLAPGRPELRQVFDTWLAGHAGVAANQSPSTTASPPTPVIVAAAEGGGIRAAYWTSLVLHKLAEDRDLGFANRLFAISNVSGSSFGSAVYAGLRQDLTDTSSRRTTANAILRERFLAPMVAKLVTGDIAQWFLPFPVPAFDRSTAMEDGFADAYRRFTSRSSMDMDFTIFRPEGATDVPVLILNSTSVQTGRRVVTSPYPWSPDSNDRLDFHELTKQDVSVATAVHNTARFPYISAAGRLRSTNGEYLEHVVDGGYFENTGAETLLDVIEHLEGLKPNARFIAIILTNSPAADRAARPNTVIWRDAESLGEFFSPFRALLQTRGARGELALRRLREHVRDDYFIDFSICRDPTDVAPHELRRDPSAAPAPPREAPLGWQLSQEMSELLEWHVERDCIARKVDLLKQAVRRAAGAVQ